MLPESFGTGHRGSSKGCGLPSSGTSRLRILERTYALMRTSLLMGLYFLMGISMGLVRFPGCIHVLRGISVLGSIYH